MLQITVKADGVTATKLPQVRIKCSCGWEEKSLHTEKDRMVDEHLFKKHRSWSYAINDHTGE